MRTQIYTVVLLLSYSATITFYIKISLQSVTHLNAYTLLSYINRLVVYFAKAKLYWTLVKMVRKTIAIGSTYCCGKEIDFNSAENIKWENA